MPFTKDLYCKAVQGADIERAIAIYIMYIVDKKNDFKGEEFFDNQDALYEMIISNCCIIEFVDDAKFKEIYKTAI